MTPSQWLCTILLFIEFIPLYSSAWTLFFLFFTVVNQNNYDCDFFRPWLGTWFLFVETLHSSWAQVTKTKTKNFECDLNFFKRVVFCAWILEPLPVKLCFRNRNDVKKQQENFTRFTVLIKASPTCCSNSLVAIAQGQNIF